MLDSNSVMIIIYFAVIIALISIYRKNFEFHGWIKLTDKIKFPLVAQLKTKLGLNLMKKIGEDHPKIVNNIAFVGIYVGYLGMLVVLGLIVQGIYQLFADPTAPAVFTPVIPGATIGGFSFPFWHTLIALFIVVVIHEFSHGVVSRANKIPVKSSGYAQVGPFSAAFVEPDEEKLVKAPKKVQNAIFAAGPWSNFLTAGLVFLILTFIFAPLTASMYDGSTITFDKVMADSPAEIAGLNPELEYPYLNGQANATNSMLYGIMQNSSPGDTLTFTAISGEEFAVILGENNNQSYIGIEGIQTRIIPNINKSLFNIFDWFADLFFWIFLLSVGLGMGNLIPAGPIDGGRMFLIACQKFFGEKKGEIIWSKTAIILFFLIIILFLIPLIRPLLSRLLPF